MGIILVVVGHSFHEYPDGKFGSTLLIYRLIYSFHMPLFIFISGFLMAYTIRMRQGDFNVKKFTVDKFKRLMIPFLVLSSVTFIPRSIMSDVADEPIPLTWNAFFASFYEYDSLVIPFFWFLQMSFTLLIIAYLILALFKKLSVNDFVAYICMIVIFGLLQMFKLTAPPIFALNRTVDYAIFFALGAAYERYHEKVDLHIKWTSVPLLILWAAIWIGCFIAFENTAYMPICSLAGILMCISLAKILEYHNITILDHLIGANYIIFLLSWYFNILCQQVLHHFVALPWWIHSILSLIFGIYIPWIFYRYMLRHPDSRITFLARHLLGQSFRHKK